MSDKKWRLSRRTILRGLGASMALPMLDVMQPGSALAAGAGPAPKRMAFLFFPNGAIMPEWKPRKQGADYDIPPTLEPLTWVKDDILVLTGLTADKARANGDGAGDHARNSAAFLTAAQPRKTSGKDIHVGVSVDQVAARKLAGQTRLPSLELGTDPGRNVGSCDSGYSCAYSSNISWRSENSPMSKEVNPRLAFERLFGSDEDRAAAKQQAKRNLYKKSILDLVRDDAKRLEKDLGTADQRKVDQYFESVREIELRIAHSEEQTESDWQPDYKKPDGIPSDFGEHLRLMADMMVLAFQGDVTRVSTFMMARAGSNRPYRGIGVSRGHHSISHHRGDKDKVADLRKIDHYHVAQFAYLVEKLRSIPEGDGTLLDNCMVLYGSGISDGNRHNHDDLPIILAGRGGGAIKTGRHLALPDETPLANLFLSMLDNMGVEEQRFGDSTGRLKEVHG